MGFVVKRGPWWAPWKRHLALFRRRRRIKRLQAAAGRAYNRDAVRRLTSNSSQSIHSHALHRSMLACLPAWRKSELMPRYFQEARYVIDVHGPAAEGQEWGMIWNVAQ